MPMDRVYVHRPTSGELWQGGWIDAEEVRRRTDENGIQVVVLMAEEYQPDSFPKGIVVLRAGIRDNGHPPQDEFSSMHHVAHAAADFVVGHLLAGRKILSSCHAGLNRSGLVTTLALKKLANAHPDAAIRLVRKARGPFAMSNPAFEAILRGTFKP